MAFAKGSHSTWFLFTTVDSNLSVLNHLLLDEPFLISIYGYHCYNHELVNVDPYDPLALVSKGLFVTVKDPVNSQQIRSIFSKYPQLTLERIVRPSPKVMDDYAQRRVVKVRRSEGLVIVEQVDENRLPLINQRF